MRLRERPDIPKNSHEGFSDGDSLVKSFSGGMSQLFVVEDRQDPTHKWVVRVLSQIDRETRAYFLREALLLKKLNSPHIIKILDHGILEGSYFNYQILEYIDGKDLRALIQNKIALGSLLEYSPTPISPEYYDSMLLRGIQIAEALVKLEREGIVHLDLNPANILDGSVRAVLIDFTLHHTSDEGAKGLDLVVGTKGFQAPEILARKPFDQRADIYSLGATLLQMFSGLTPLNIKNEIFRKQSGETFEELATKYFQRINTTQERRLPPALLMIILKCLKQNPDDRYEHASEVVNDLRGILLRR